MADKSMAGLNDLTSQETRTAAGGKKMRVGIIGCGRIARYHVKSYLNQPDVEIVAGCDLIPGKARAIIDGISRSARLGREVEITIPEI